MWLESNKNYLRFDEKSNTFDSLEKLQFFLGNIRGDLNFWKWAIIALHSALYGSMILALKGSNPDRVSKLPIKKKEIHTIDRDGKPILIEIEDRKLISFPETFKRIQQRKHMEMYVGSKIFKSEHCHCEAIEWINDELRNPFLHFVPRGWSIGIQGLKEIFRDCLEIIEFCLFQSGNALLEEDERERFKQILENIKNHKELK